MKDLTADMLVDFNKDQHNHGIPKNVEEKLDLFIQHLALSAKNDLEMASWMIFHLIHEHPFIDGNKRTAVFVLDYYLSKKEYFLDNSTKIHIILKYTGPDWAPKKIYSDLYRILSEYNPKFKA